MSCAPNFSSELSLSCLIDFAKAVRLGVSPSLVKQALWLAGCLMEKFVPDDTVSLQSDVEYDSLESALTAFEAVCESTPDVTATAIPWAALIPIILEIIRLIKK
jgi:hypothetical protein